MTSVIFEDRMEVASDKKTHEVMGKTVFLLTKQRLKNCLGNIHCPHHNAEPKVVIMRKKDSRAKLLIEGCCNRVVDRVMEKL